ncbi:MAG: tetratricopeptide repeat protein [bacterium]|nr:tetratricopeptide repeat protein [bacterium]
MPAPHVRRLIRELVLPDQADIVVQRPKYWTPEFCWLYFDRCDELISEAPENGLEAAEVCPELAYLIQIMTRMPQPRLRLRALAVLGTAYRATDDLEQAEQTYGEAFDLLRSESIPRLDEANLLFRFAALRSFQNRYQEAVEWASRSVAIYRQAPDDIQRRHLGEALTARGYIHHMHGHLTPAMTDWGQALPATDVKLTPRIFYAIVHNLVLGITEGAVYSGDLSLIEHHVAQSKKFFSRKPLSHPKLKILWLQGMIMMRFGSTRRGEAAFRKAIEGFLKLNNIVEMALVSITLSRHLHAERRFEELQTLAVETSDVCQRLCRNEEIKRAVLIWKEAIVAQTISEQVFATTFRALADCSFAEAVKRA